MGVVHIVGEPEGMVQKCDRCGYLLADNRNVMVPDGQSPGYWETGSLVQVWEGNPRHMRRVEAMPDDGEPCVGAH